MSYTSKTAKIKNIDITEQHIDIWRCVAGYYPFLTHYVSINICINCNFFTVI